MRFPRLKTYTACTISTTDSGLATSGEVREVMQAHQLLLMAKQLGEASIRAVAS